MRIALALSLALTIGPVGAVAQTDSRFLSGQTVWNGKAAPRAPALLAPAMLDVHNAARRSYRVEPLVWNDALAASAKVYASKLAASANFAHDPQEGVSPPQGENLFMGTRSAYSFAAMVQLWVDERRDFKSGRFPDVVTSGHWSKVGHYTQIIWPTTRELGCALTSSATSDYLVCRYLPAGNWLGSVLK